MLLGELWQEHTVHTGPVEMPGFGPFLIHDWLTPHGYGGQL